MKAQTKVVAYIIRQGKRPGEGRYFYEPSEEWFEEKEFATRYCSAQHARDTRCNGAAPFDESRTVALVRKGGR